MKRAREIAHDSPLGIEPGTGASPDGGETDGRFWFAVGRDGLSTSPDRSQLSARASVGILMGCRVCAETPSHGSLSPRRTPRSACVHPPMAEGPEGFLYPG